jgi:ankyrin repeat protein
MALLHYVIDQIKLKNIRKTERVNALFLAAFQGHLEVYTLLMGKLRDKNPGNSSILNNTGITPLHYAAQNGHFSVCELIIANTPDKNPVTRYVNGRYQSGHIYGSTPLHFAAQNGNWEVCKLLIDNIVEKNPADHSGQTPFHLAAEYGHTAICKHMFGHLSDRNPAIKERGKTALHCAAEKGHVEVFKLIMDDLVDNNINNPEITRNSSFFKDLLCPEDSRNNSYTPFHLAVMNGRFEVCQFFLETIGNRLIKGIYVPYEGTAHAWKREDAVRFVRESLLRGRSPYDMAEEHGHHEICKLLNYYGSNWQIFHLSTKIIYAAGCGPSKQR